MLNHHISTPTIRPIVFIAAGGIPLSDSFKSLNYTYTIPKLPYTTYLGVQVEVHDGLMYY
jgi:hypothetical protein